MTLHITQSCEQATRRVNQNVEIKSFLSEFHLSPLEVVPWLLQEELERDEINALTFRVVKFLAGKGVKN